MMKFFPLWSDWSCRNSKYFLEHHKDIVDAVVAFIHENSNCPLNSFSSKDAQKTLTIKCSDGATAIRKSKLAFFF